MTHLAEAIQGVKAGSLGHVAMQLCSQREAAQAEQHLHPVRLVLGAEEDDGPAGAEGAGTERHQHSFLVGCLGTLQGSPKLASTGRLLLSGHLKPGLELEWSCNRIAGAKKCARVCVRLLRAGGTADLLSDGTVINA